MKITDIELTYLDVPFTSHTNEHMQYWLPHWHIVQNLQNYARQQRGRLGRNNPQLHLGGGAR